MRITATISSPLKILGFAFLFFWLNSCASTSSSDSFEPRKAIPKRSKTAISGSLFAKGIDNFSETQREAAILRELRRGNIPRFLRNFRAVYVSEEIKGVGKVNAVFWVTADYLAIGSNKDWVRFPMNPISAQRIADHYGCLLPTRKMVNLIYQNAATKLEPLPMDYGPKMVSIGRYVEHNNKIQAQLQKQKPSGIIAGHKKDIVITNRLVKKRRRVAIYGWHRLNGKAIQPLSLVHGNYYADYSHGVRLVASMMIVNGTLYPVAEVLRDPKLSAILSDEGTLTYLRYPTEGELAKKKWYPRGWNGSS